MKIDDLWLGQMVEVQTQDGEWIRVEIMRIGWDGKRQVARVAKLPVMSRPIDQIRPATKDKPCDS